MPDQSNGKHYVACNKVCDFHEGNSSRLSSLEAAAKVSVIILSLVMGVFVVLVGYVFKVQADEISILRTSQSTHERSVNNAMNLAVDELRLMKKELENRMSKIESEQNKIKGSNERILRYLEILIDDRGILLNPRDANGTH